MTPKELYNNINSKKIIENLEKRNMQGFFVKTKEDALKKALELIPEKSTICWGGSQSILQIGLIDALYNGDYQLFDRAKATTQEEIDSIYRKAFDSDFYLASANAITLDGKIVNIDGTGNRVAAMIYGPKNVILIVGINKIEKDQASAIDRVKNYASPINDMRLNRNTPCKIKGNYYDCLSSETICCVTSITRYSRYKNRIKVILVEEELGY
ncbi:lactate utilization protein [[Clostridium] colinum]|uniref:lactate utilization protein n=1 Tax=[Clostridium] colinum TaxID=36835 RepID=UPI00202518E0|nr:lactate utilization protein [[Clostridium] colinum]